MRLNPYGNIAWEEWLRTADVRPNIVLDTFVVMPNHLHGIILVTTPMLPASPVLQPPQDSGL